jgi:hypothetical protein
VRATPTSGDPVRRREPARAPGRHVAGPTLRMTGIARGDVRVQGPTLRMTGIAIGAKQVSGPSLRMTGVGE